MKKDDLAQLDNEKFTNALKEVMGGEVAQPLGSLPPTDTDLVVTAIEPTSFTEKDDKGNIKVDAEGKEITHNWIKVSFSPSGSLSLSSILRCPEYKWKSDNYLERVKALAADGVKHKFRYQEPRKSRYNRDYKILHMEPKEL